MNLKEDYSGAAPRPAYVPPKSGSEHALTIVLPIFNEESNLGKLFEKIDRSLSQDSIPYRIVAVDDGSTDGTSRVLDRFRAQLPLELVSHKQNQGLGAAIRSGLIEAIRRASPDDVIVTMDADESHTPALIARMLELIGQGFDVVIASRFQVGAGCHGVPAHRRALSRAASMLFRALFPTPGVRDFTCGYRAYRVSALRRAIQQYGDSFFEFEGFQCMVDLLLKLRGTGARIVEVPIVLRYDLKQGQSKMRIFRTSVRTLQLAFRRRLGF